MALPLQQLFSLLIHGNPWCLYTTRCTAGERTGDTGALCWAVPAQKEQNLPAREEGSQRVHQHLSRKLLEESSPIAHSHADQPDQTPRGWCWKLMLSTPQLGVLPGVGGHHTPDQTHRSALFAICNTHFSSSTTELESHNHHLFRNNCSDLLD